MNSPDKKTQRLESMVNTVMGVKKDEEGTRGSLPVSSTEPDWPLMAKYVGGTVVQIAVMIAALWGLQQLVEIIPSAYRLFVAIAFFAVASIRSRLFSPLNNTRSSRTYDSIQRPGWAPPPIAFPIIWMSIAVLRVTASCWVWQASGENFLALPLMLFMVHLALGDTWNTIFTVQSRLGAALPVVLLGPLTSSIVVTSVYGLTVAKAGYILIPMCAWLTIASVLVFDIWRLNGKEPLYPVKVPA